MLIQILNVLGDVIVLAAALYAAYSMKKHEKMSVSFVMISAAFLISALVFARDLRSVNYYAPMAFSFVIFAVFMVEATSYMIKGFEKLRITHVLYIFVLLPFLLGNTQLEVLFGSSIMISHVIVAACFAVLIDNKKYEARALSFMGFLGAAFPLIMIVYNPAILFAPWNSIFLVGKILLAVFFLGFVILTKRNIYNFFDPAYFNERRRTRK